MHTKQLRSSYPLGHLCNPATEYTTSLKTNVAATFERARRALEQSGAQASRIARQPIFKVVTK